MVGGRIFYVGGKVVAKPRAWGKEKSILLNIKRERKLK